MFSCDRKERKAYIRNVLFLMEFDHDIIVTVNDMKK